MPPTSRASATAAPAAAEDRSDSRHTYPCSPTSRPTTLTTDAPRLAAHHPSDDSTGARRRRIGGIRTNRRAFPTRSTLDAHQSIDDNDDGDGDDAVSSPLGASRAIGRRGVDGWRRIRARWGLGGGRGGARLRYRGFPDAHRRTSTVSAECPNAYIVWANSITQLIRTGARMANRREPRERRGTSRDWSIR